MLTQFYDAYICGTSGGGGGGGGVNEVAGGNGDQYESHATAVIISYCDLIAWYLC